MCTLIVVWILPIAFVRSADPDLARNLHNIGQRTFITRMAGHDPAALFNMLRMNT